MINLQLGDGSSHFNIIVLVLRVALSHGSLVNHQIWVQLPIVPSQWVSGIATI